MKYFRICGEICEYIEQNLKAKNKKEAEKKFIDLFGGDGLDCDTINIEEITKKEYEEFDIDIE